MSEPQSSETIYFEDEKYYLIGFGLQSGQYLAVQAIQEGSSWALQLSAENVPGSDVSGYKLFNKKGEQIGVQAFETGEEASEFGNAVCAAILAYNGQEAYFEADFELVLPDDYEVIP